jgi:solute carrier family 38 (sodium-coupled neutral amino acid transporter), member 9
MTREAQNREHIRRDIIIGYVLVFFSYSIIGALGYSSRRALADCFPPNFLNEPVYSDTFIPAIIARFALLAQLLSVLTLLLFLIRIQFFGYFFNAQYPSFASVTSMNITLLTMATLFSTFFPDDVATIIRFSGAIGGFCYVFCLPVLVQCKSKNRKSQLRIFDVMVAVMIISFGLFLMCSQFIPQSESECTET